MADFGWSYPPGVTGLEPEIAGSDEPCPNCGTDCWPDETVCTGCGWNLNHFGEEPDDEDRRYDELKEGRM